MLSLVLILFFIYTTNGASFFDPYFNATSIKITKLDPPIKPNSKLCDDVIVSESDVARDFFGRHYHWERPLKNARQVINISVQLVLSSIVDIVIKKK